MTQWTNTTTYIQQLNTSFPLHGQVQFPAVQVPSADPNCFDDYEEGTFTPSVGGSATYTTQNGLYRKKAGEVTVQIAPLTINAIGSGSTGLISGLPFTAAAATQAGTVGGFTGAASNFVMVSCYVNTGSTQMGVSTLAAAGVSMSLPGVFFASAASIYASSTYFV